MKILKGLALSFLSFLLFLSLTIFGLAFTLNSTLLNPNFLNSELEKTDFSEIIQAILSEQEAGEDFPEELMTALIDTIDKLEAPVKAQLSAAIDDTYDYLLGKKDQPDLAATLGDTFLNSAFVDSVMDELDLSSLVEEVLLEGMGGEEFPEEFGTALVNIITDLEPMIKEKISAVVDPIFDYLLGETQDIDLASTLRSTILTSDFVLSLMDKLALSSLASEFLGGELTGQIPEEMEFLAEHLDDIIADLESTIKEQISAAADPLLDYLLGLSPTVSIEISLAPIMESLEDALKEVLMEQLPPAYAYLPQSQLNQLFAEYFAELTGMVPLTFDIGEMLTEMMPADMITDVLAEAEDALGQVRQDIAEAIAEAEEMLEQARGYVSQFQTGYYILLGFMALLILGIVLIHRQVKGATRWLGIVSLIYGVLWYAGILVGKNFAEKQLAATMTDIPASLQELPLQFLNDFMAPLQMLSLGLLIGGVVLIVVSFVYPRLRQPVDED